MITDILLFTIGYSIAWYLYALAATPTEARRAQARPEIVEKARRRRHTFTCTRTAKVLRINGIPCISYRITRQHANENLN